MFGDRPWWYLFVSHDSKWSFNEMMIQPWKLLFEIDFSTWRWCLNLVAFKLVRIKIKNILDSILGDIPPRQSDRRKRQLHGNFDDSFGETFQIHLTQIRPPKKKG